MFSFSYWRRDNMSFGLVGEVEEGVVSPGNVTRGWGGKVTEAG